MELQNKGRVVIVGAGPGDPELITAKAIRYLQQADVVLTDRLVSDAILNNYVNKDAIVIHVGKQCRLGASTPQTEINRLMIEHAMQNKLVVRLKGGDASIFSNILDELQALKQHQIPYEIVPGVTAALGAAAYAGMPLTARGYSNAVRLMTYHKQDVIPDEYWEDLANTNDTVIFYMSSGTLNELVAQLIRYNISKEKLLAVIEQATTPLQNVHVTNIYDYHKKMGDEKFVSPSLVIIGKVVALHEQFRWVENSNSKEYYFKPVASLKDTTQQGDKTKDNVARA